MLEAFCCRLYTHANQTTSLRVSYYWMARIFLFNIDFAFKLSIELDTTGSFTIFDSRRFTLLTVVRSFCLCCYYYSFESAWRPIRNYSRTHTPTNAETGKIQPYNLVTEHPLPNAKQLISLINCHISSHLSNSIVFAMQKIEELRTLILAQIVDWLRSMPLQLVAF